jgi:AraC-like DNA-binding protein
MDQRVLEVIALMKSSLHKGWSADRLAERVNLSPSRLHQLFKEETGLPPARYLRLLRMEEARGLLEATHLSVKQVMARVGVTDESHFVRDFKKTYGLSPAQYRKQFLSGRTQDGRPPKPPRTNHAHAPSGLRPKRHAPTPSAFGFAAPPLLLRRPSHPRQLTPDKVHLVRARKRAELLSLLILRHEAFSDLTTAITDNIVRGRAGSNPIHYRPRRSATSRRLPPSAERPQAPSVRRPRLNF